MATRPLRQYYDEISITDDLGDFGDAWRRHRARFGDALAALGDEQWTTPSRCTEWDVRGVVAHLVTVDQFWVFTLGMARAGEEPGKALLHFDPSTSTNPMVGPLLELTNRELLDRYLAGTDVFAGAIASFTADDWAKPGESPLGHLPARYLMLHAFWDSWLHERDAFLPLGTTPVVEPDEVRPITGFALVFAGLQGGVVGDALAVGPIPDAPVDANLAFDEFRDAPLHLTVDTGVAVRRGDTTTATPAGPAAVFLDAFTGRASWDALDGLPADLVAQLDRAARVL